MNYWLLALAIPLWTIQYLIWVPVVLLWRTSIALIRFALTIGLVGILLLFLPVFGWIILLFWLLSRRDDRRYRELLEAIAAQKGATAHRRSIWSPWLLTGVRGV